MTDTSAYPNAAAAAADLKNAMKWVADKNGNVLETESPHITNALRNLAFIAEQAVSLATIAEEANTQLRSDNAALRAELQSCSNALADAEEDMQDKVEELLEARADAEAAKSREQHLCQGSEKLRMENISLRKELEALHFKFNAICGNSMAGNLYTSRDVSPGPSRMSHDRVQFTVPANWVSKWAVQLRQAFNIDTSKLSRSQDITVICRPSQFARFIVLRDNAGTGNQMAILNMQLLESAPAPKAIDVSMERNRAWDK